jgi:hypothetical protein
MNLVINIFQRLFGSPKTTAGGVIAGTGIAVAVSTILEQAGCQFSNVQWFEIMGLVFGGPALVGGLSTDNAKAVVPISPLTGPGTGIGAVLLAIMAMGLTACVSDMDLGGGRVMNLAKVEARSAFGVNDSRSRLRDCLKTRDEQDITSYVYTDCRWMESEWRQSSSPGQGGQIAAGALQGIGLGVAGVLIGNGSASATATAGAAATAGSKGH